MNKALQNKFIARFIVGAMTIDGSLDRKEREKVVRTLERLHMSELIADFGAAVDDLDDAPNMYQEAKEFVGLLGAHAAQITPMVFRLVVEVIASDRFVSLNEAGYLSGLAKRFNIPMKDAQRIIKEVMAQVRGRLEVAASSVDSYINGHLKELLSFDGAEDLVGEVERDSLSEMIHSAHEAMSEGESVSLDDVERAFAILGLSPNAKLADAEHVWHDTIDNLNLPKLASLGETFVTAAINQITTINNAYKTILQFHERMTGTQPARRAA